MSLSKYCQFKLLLCTYKISCTVLFTAYLYLSDVATCCLCMLYANLSNHYTTVLAVVSKFIWLYMLCGKTHLDMTNNVSAEY